MATDHRERELKFDVPADWRLPDPVKLAGEGGRVDHTDVQVTSTYFDTPARDLFACRLTLRRRAGDLDAGWQLKVPDGDARLEIRVDATDAADVPAELRELTLGVCGGAQPAPVAVLRMHRGLHRLVGADSRVLAEIVVDDVHASLVGEPAADTQWREVEVELVEGGEALLRRADKWLRKHGATRASWASKIGKALGQEHPPVRDTASLRGVIGAYLDTQFAAIVRGDVDLRRGRDAIHPTRIATRRYRSALRVFGAALDTARAEALDVELAWFATVLGEVRDRHVLRPHLDAALGGLGPELPPPAVAAAGQRITAALDDEQRAAELALAEAMNGPRYLALLHELRVWRDDLPGLVDAPASQAARYLKRAGTVVEKRLAKAGPGPHHDEAMHRVRKAAKRVRYAAELAEPELGARARSVAKRARRTQRTLGNRQDAVLAAEFLRRLGPVADGGAAAFVLGVLYAHERSVASGG